MAKSTGKAQGPAELKLDFKFEKATPGTMRYKEPDAANGSRPAVGTIYITKEALKALEPANVQELEVIIRPKGAG